MYARRKGEHGSAILESFLSMILIGMILFGILQLFQLVVADMITEYAAFRGARSAAVGFREDFSKREAMVKAVPASGQMIIPDPRNYPGYQPVESEEDLLRSFLKNHRHMEYANWNGENAFHMNYHCPQYGEPMLGGCSLCSDSRNTHIRVSSQTFGESVNFNFEFANYPLIIPLHEWLTGKESITISSETELTNHSAAYLE